MAKPIQKHQHIFATGKGTYYPGRTKPLVGIRLSPLAAYLQSHYSTFASPCGNKGDVYKITLVGQPALFRYALLNDRIMHHSCSVVGKAKDDAYKIVGQIMLKSNKEDLKKELDDRKKILELRLKTIEKQEEVIKTKLDTLKKAIEEELKNK